MKTFKEFIAEQKIGDFELDTVVKDTRYGTVNVYMFKNKGKPNEQKYWFELGYDKSTLDAYRWDESDDDYIEDSAILKNNSKLRTAILKAAKTAK